MLTFLPDRPHEKPKPVYETIAQREKRAYPACTNAREHQPFWYWRDDAQDYVCDCCNWESAYQGGKGFLWCYPKEVRALLQKALAERGILVNE